MNLRPDFMRINMDNKEIYAYGRPDTVNSKEPTEAGGYGEDAATRLGIPRQRHFYTMDVHHLQSRFEKSAHQRGRDTGRGGIPQGNEGEEDADNTINIANGRYTTPMPKTRRISTWR